jgi:hypothetical protein
MLEINRRNMLIGLIQLKTREKQKNNNKRTGILFVIG